MRNSYWMAPALIACNIAFAAGERGNSTIDGGLTPPGAATTASSTKGNADSTSPNVNADTRAHSRVATSRDAAKATKQIRSNAKKLRRVKPVGAAPTLAKPESASPTGVGAMTAPASIPSGTVARSSSMNTSSTVTVPSTILNAAPDSILVRSGPAPLPVTSRATVKRGENNVHSFAWSLSARRTGIGFRHWKRVDDSKFTHCLQQCNAAPHFGQLPVKSVPGCNVVAQL